MLHAISWGAFCRTLLLATVLYYAAIGYRWYRADLISWLKKSRSRVPLLAPLLLFLMTGAKSFAQTADGNNGLNQANTMVRGYFDSGTQLMYAVGALIGLIGAIDVVNAFHKHADNARGKLIGWLGACIFLVVVATVLKSFFGL